MRGILGLVAVSFSAFVFADTYNLNAEFSHQSNPNGVWSYGLRDGGTNFELLTDNTHVAGWYASVIPGATGWSRTVFPSPLVAKNYSLPIQVPPYIFWEQGLMVFHGYSDLPNRVAVIRWSSPLPYTSATLVGSLRRVEDYPNPATYRVLVNGSLVQQGTLFTMSELATINLQVPLLGSDKIELEAGWIGSSNGTGLIPELQIVATANPLPSSTVSGSFTLSDVVAPPAFPRNISVRVLQGAQILGQATIPSGGTAPFALNVQGIGSAQLIVDGPTQIRRRIPITLGNGTVSVPNVILSNGDADRSGEVDAADIDSIIAFFGSEGGFEDLDLSGEVDAADIDIAISNFGLVDE